MQNFTSFGARVAAFIFAAGTLLSACQVDVVELGADGGEVLVPEDLAQVQEPDFREWSRGPRCRS
jgi:hypothetical protein